jgi:hypothetical protein
VLKWIAARSGAGTDPGACPPLPAMACAKPPNEY